jgi:hypothetical protein
LSLRPNSSNFISSLSFSEFGFSRYASLAVSVECILSTGFKSPLPTGVEARDDGPFRKGRLTGGQAWILRKPLYSRGESLGKA